MSTINATSSSSNAWASVSAQRNQHQAKMFAKVDTDGSGGVDLTELSTLVSDISKKTGVSLGDSKELFNKMDSNADGSLSSDELGQGMKDIMPPPSTVSLAGASQRPSGPPPAGGPGGPRGSSSASASNTANTTYDPLDTNQDGTVSEMERLAGALKELAQTTETDSSGNTSSTELAKLAQKLYDQISTNLYGGSSGGQLDATV